MIISIERSKYQKKKNFESTLLGKNSWGINFNYIH